jgi:hypothetical protein
MWTSHEKPWFSQEDDLQIVGSPHLFGCLQEHNIYPPDGFPTEKSAVHSGDIMGNCKRKSPGFVKSLSNGDIGNEQ